MRATPEQARWNRPISLPRRVTCPDDGGVLEVGVDLLDRRRVEDTSWLTALAATDVPLHLCWGDADAVARVEMAHHLKGKVCPDAALTVMPGVGHFCQLSDPAVWVSSVLDFHAGSA